MVCYLRKSLEIPYQREYQESNVRLDRASSGTIREHSILTPPKESRVFLVKDNKRIPILEKDSEHLTIRILRGTKRMSVISNLIRSLEYAHKLA